MTTIKPLLSVVLQLRGKSEEREFAALLPLLADSLNRLAVGHEVIVVLRSSRAGDDKALEKLSRAGGPPLVVVPAESGYGAALKRGLSAARGDYVVTMDADMSHDPQFLQQMWAVRQTAALIIGSRYVAGGEATVPPLRRALSQSMNGLLASLLAMPVRDLSSGFRLYSRDLLTAILPELQSDDYDLLEEIVVRAQIGGWPLREVPIRYRPRRVARSNAVARHEAKAFLRNCKSIWHLRNNASACDYDARAYNSRIWPQRYWQRRRFQIISEFIKAGGLWLDIACGSSQIIRSHPAMVGFDINLPKLRYLRATNRLLVQGTMFNLPFKDASLDGVLCSEVIEHVLKDPVLLAEMRRVLKPGGTLVLGTPDYSSAIWNAIEKVYGVLMPASYAHEHISHYTRRELQGLLAGNGFKIQGEAAIVWSELIFRAVKLDDR